jgi:hypothetical protein
MTVTDFLLLKLSQGVRQRSHQVAAQRIALGWISQGDDAKLSVNVDGN